MQFLAEDDRHQRTRSDYAAKPAPSPSRGDARSAGALSRMIPAILDTGPL